MDGTKVTTDWRHEHASTAIEEGKLVLRFSPRHLSMLLLMKGISRAESDGTLEVHPDHAIAPVVVIDEEQFLRDVDAWLNRELGREERPLDTILEPTVLAVADAGLESTQKR